MESLPHYSLSSYGLSVRNRSIHGPVSKALQRCIGDARLSCGLWLGGSNPDLDAVSANCRTDESPVPLDNR